jgi:hypothetical protein
MQIIDQIFMNYNYHINGFDIIYVTMQLVCSYYVYACAVAAEKKLRARVYAWTKVSASWFWSG